MKVLGSLMVVASGAVAALMVISSMRSRIERLADFRGFLNDILIGISYSACELTYIIQKSGSGFAEKTSECYADCGELSQAWGKAACSFFKGVDLRTVRAFFEEFGRCDVVSQQEKIREYMCLFSELEKAARDDMEKKGKASAALCFFVSVTAVLILI